MPVSSSRCHDDALHPTALSSCSVLFSYYYYIIRLILLPSPASPEEGKKRNSEELQLADADFDQALIDYTPTSLRNVPLHQPGEVGWENIGGLTSVKKTLIETLQWPAKVLG